MEIHACAHDVPSIPPWFAELILLARHFTQRGVLEALGRYFVGCGDDGSVKCEISIGQTIPQHADRFVSAHDVTTSCRRNGPIRFQQEEALTQARELNEPWHLAFTQLLDMLALPHHSR
jgi:hypothetical protein